MDDYSWQSKCSGHRARTGSELGLSQTRAAGEVEHGVLGNRRQEVRRQVRIR